MIIRSITKVLYDSCLKIIKLYFHIHIFRNKQSAGKYSLYLNKFYDSGLCLITDSIILSIFDLGKTPKTFFKSSAENLSFKKV